MSLKKFPVGGEPDFTFMSFEELTRTLETVSRLCLAYKSCKNSDEMSIEKTLREIWGHVNAAYLDRMDEKPVSVFAGKRIISKRCKK